MLIRPLITLLATLGVVGVMAETAAAATATVKVRGAGSVFINGDNLSHCEMPLPATNQTERTCGTYSVSTGLIHVFSWDIPAGWTFKGFEGCSWAASTLCQAGDAATVTAVFADETPPALGDVAITRSVTAERTATATWTAGADSVEQTCAVGGGPAVACTSPHTFTTGEGAHTLTVRAADENGNVAAKQGDFVTIDTALTTVPRARSSVAAGPFAARTVGGDAFDCSVDGRAFVACGTADSAGVASLAMPSLPDGEHALRVRARRGADVDLLPAMHRWTIDTTAPETTLAADLSFSADEPATFRCRLDAAPAEPCASPYAPPALEPGRHTLEVAAVDAAGNADPTPAVHRWTVAAPVAAASAPPAVVAPLKLTYAFRDGRFTTLSANKAVTVTVKRPAKRVQKTTLAKLVGKPLPNGTRVTVRAGRETRTLVVRRGKVLTASSSRG